MLLQLHYKFHFFVVVFERLMTFVCHVFRVIVCIFAMNLFVFSFWPRFRLTCIIKIISDVSVKLHRIRAWYNFVVCVYVCAHSFFSFWILVFYFLRDISCYITVDDASSVSRCRQVKSVRKCVKRIDGTASPPSAHHWHKTQRVELIAISRPIIHFVLHLTSSGRSLSVVWSSFSDDVNSLQATATTT